MSEKMLPDIAHLHPDDDKSLYVLSSDAFRKGMELIPKDYFLKDERELEKIVKPTPTLNSLRYRLWEEFGAAVDEGRSMKMVNVFRGICSNDYFYQVICKESHLLVWLVTPPRDFENVAHEALMFGLKRLRDILELSETKKDRHGHDVPDKEVIRIKLAIVKMLDARLKGAPVQKHEISSKSFSVSGSVGEMKDLMENATVEQLQRKIRELRGPAPKKERAVDIDVTPKKGFKV